VRRQDGASSACDDRQGAGGTENKYNGATYDELTERQQDTILTDLSVDKVATFTR